MSDCLNTLPWKPWLPNDLVEPSALLQAKERRQTKEITPASMPLDPVVDQQQHLEQLQRQAQQQGQQIGYSEGQQQGYDAGFQLGLEEGRQQGVQAGLQQQQPFTEHWQQLVAEFQHTLDALDSVIVSRLMQLALTAAKQVIGQPAICDGTALLNQIQQLIQQEPMFSGKPQLRVHPDDLQHVEQHLGSTLHAHGWRLLADNQLHPGGCKVSAEEGDLDASLAARWYELCRLATPGERG